MRVHLLQLDITWEDPVANLAAIQARCDSRRPAPGSLVVLPELCTTGFSMNAATTLAEPVDGPSVQALVRLATRWQIQIVAGLPIRDAAGVARNSSLLIGPDGLRARYDKLHPFSPAGEPTAFPAGETVVVVPAGEVALAPFICYDLRFPEIFRTAAAAGADCFVVIASWPEVRVEHWRLLLRARAIENQAFVIGVNRAGADPFFRYPGRSAVIHPSGQVLLELGEDEAMESVEIRAEEAREWRDRLPFLRDRRDVPPAVRMLP